MARSETRFSPPHCLAETGGSSAAIIGSAGGLVEDIAFERAFEGVEHNVYDEYDEVVCTKRVYNDRLLMWLLSHLKPERYGAAAARRPAEPARHGAPDVTFQPPGARRHPAGSRARLIRSAWSADTAAWRWCRCFRRA